MRRAGRTAAISALVAVLCLAALGWVLLTRQAPAADAGAWAGVDETVIERFATEAGRQPREPLINTDQGDMLLFLFALAGAAGGFVAGYCWRKLVSEKNGRR